eukprot:s89_g5.t3
MRRQGTGRVLIGAGFRDDWTLEVLVDLSSMAPAELFSFGGWLSCVLYLGNFTSKKPYTSADPDYPLFVSGFRTLHGRCVSHAIVCRLGDRLHCVPSSSCQMAGSQYCAVRQNMQPHPKVPPPVLMYQASERSPGLRHFVSLRTSCGVWASMTFTCQVPAVVLIVGLSHRRTVVVFAGDGCGVPEFASEMATCAATPSTPTRRPQLSLNEEVLQAAPGEVFCAGHTTPANHVRPNLGLSVWTGTPSFRGSGVASHAVVMQPTVARAATAEPSSRPELSVATSDREPTPPVLPSPTNAQRQPMMARSSRSHRAVVQAANWGAEVSAAMANTLPMRPATAPMAPISPTLVPAAPPPSRASGGYAAVPSLDLEAERVPTAPRLDTPTNSQRQVMMSRSNRSVRNRVMTTSKAEVETVPAPLSASLTPGMTPVALHAGATPKPRGLNVIALEAEAMDSTGAQFRGLSGLSTPTNLDRRDAQMSLQLGTPSFRGSAMAAPGSSAPLQGSSSQTPSGLSGTRLLPEA